MRKNLGVWRGWKLGECFSGDMETSGCRFSSVETCHSCTLETFGVHSRYVETSVAFVCLVELRARSVVGCGRSVVIFFSAFRGTRWLCGGVGTSVFAFVYIFRSVGGVLSAMQHRAVGGASDGGVKGTPLNNPLFG